MALSLNTLVDKVRRRLKDAGRAQTGDIESGILEALKRVSRSVINSPERVALEITANVTLGAADSNGLQQGALPSTIIQESIRSGDVTHADLTRPLEKKDTVSDLTYILSTSVLGFFAIHEGKLFTRRGASSLATGTPAVVRGVRLLGATTVIATELGFVPAELEDMVVEALYQYAIGQQEAS
jgi:hypothetical protein